MKNSVLMAPVALAVTGMALFASAADSNGAEKWRRVDFDADLTSYIVNLGSVKRDGNNASLWELNVPGRTGISFAAGHHTMVQRLFNCADSSQRLGEVLVHRSLGAKPEKIPHEDLSFKVQGNSLDELEMKFACGGEVWPDTAATSNYTSLQQAVAKAFGDAIKLPREQSNRTLRGMGPMTAGPPRQGGGPPVAN
jgi:hypothetical protein